MIIFKFMPRGEFLTECHHICTHRGACPWPPLGESTIGRLGEEKMNSSLESDGAEGQAYEIAGTLLVVYTGVNVR